MSSPRSSARDTLRDEIDLLLIEIALGKDFDPNQPRNPHTGEWIDTPGLPSVQLLEHAGSPISSGLPPWTTEFDAGLHGPARTSFDAEDAEAAKGVLTRMAQAHRWPDKPAIPIRPIDVGTGVRGEFVQRGAQSREIRVQVDLGAEQTRQSLTHEMAHFLDASLAGGRGGFLSESFGPDGLPSPAMQDFLRVARGSHAMQTVMQYAQPAEKDYLNRPRELWARAYAQWITGTSKTGNPGSWLDSDFEAIARAVEAVLEEQGLFSSSGDEK